MFYNDQISLLATSDNIHCRSNVLEHPNSSSYLYGYEWYKGLLNSQRLKKDGFPIELGRAVKAKQPVSHIYSLGIQVLINVYTDIILAGNMT